MFLTAVLIASFAVANAQIDLEERIRRENVVRGAIFKNGEVIEGYIRKMGTTVWQNDTFPAPWEFQGNIRFIPKDVFETSERIRANMFRRYRPRDIQGYRYEDMIFESVRYADMSAAGANMIPRQMFLRRIIYDRISVFHHFASPPTLVTGAFGEELVRAAQPFYVFRRDGRLRLIDGVGGINMNRDWEDCPYVQAKVDNDEYTGSRLERRLQAIKDFNKHCQ